MQTGISSVAPPPRPFPALREREVGTSWFAASRRGVKLADNPWRKPQ